MLVSENFSALGAQERVDSGSTTTLKRVSAQGARGDENRSMLLGSPAVKKKLE
jgi:hypothetical protein